MYGQFITRAFLTTVLHPSFFVFCYPHRTANALRASDDVTVRSDMWGLRVAEGSLFKRTREIPAPVRVISKTIRCSDETPSRGRYHESKSDHRYSQAAEMRLFQCWRNPMWLCVTQTRMGQRDLAKGENGPNFPTVTDALFRAACVGLVLAGLGCMHHLYNEADRTARKQVQIASANANANISIGRVVRCNPITGFRVKNVLVSKSFKTHMDQVGKASYVHASVSGYVGLFVYRRPLMVNIIVSHGTLVISDLLATEYGGQKGESLNLEEPVQMLIRGWRSFPVLASPPFSGLLQPGTISLDRSQFRIEGVQQGPTGQSAHSVNVLNVSAHLHLRGGNPEVSTDSTQTGSTQTIFWAAGSFLGGGHARVQVHVKEQIDDSGNASVSSVDAGLKCSEVNIGSIANFFSLPFKLKDGTCTGNMELELSPTRSYAPRISGQADVKSLGMRFDPNPENPELRNVTGRLRFKPNGVILDHMEGELGSIPLEAKGQIDFDEGFNVESHARPFDVNKVLETFALNHFVPLEGSVIGKAVVRGDIHEPCVSGWIKSVGNRAIADRIILKSALITYDWDAVAGNLLFPSMQAAVVGGGELVGSGGIYFDMTQETRYGRCNDKHHARNPKSTYWNSDQHVSKTLPPLPSDEFEIDRWAPFRPYDSMDFEINGSNVPGGNLIRWYGQKFGSAAADAVGQIYGFCRISGHAQDPNSRLVWSTTREDCSRNSSGELPEVPLASNFRGIRAQSKLKYSDLSPDKDQGPSQVLGASTSAIVSSSESYSEEDGTAFLGGLVYMKLGDLPEARRIKARTTLRRFIVKRLFSADPHFKHILLKTPNVIASMDTLFKGTVCMRPSWADDQEKRARHNIPLGLVSLEGGLAIRSLSLNGVMFRKIISGSLSLSATDVSLTLSESYPQDASRGLRDWDHQRGTVPPERAFERLEIKLNTKGLFHINSRWDDSELSASMSMSDDQHRIFQLLLKGVDLQQLSGRCNPVLGNQHVQGVLTTSIELDWTYHEGHMQLSVSDLALGPVHFELINGQLSLKDGQISLNEADLRHGLSKYKLEGRYSMHENEADSEWFINVIVDQAYVRDVSHLLNCGTKLLTFDSGKLCFADHPNQNSHTRDSLSLRSENRFLHGGSAITYWEVPQGLQFSEETKWFNQSNATGMDTDIATLFDLGKYHGNKAGNAPDCRNSFSGRIAIYHPPIRNRDKQMRANQSSDRGPLAELRNITLSFDFVGRDWIFDMGRLEVVSVSGILEDGGLSLNPFQIKGDDGLLLEGQGRFTNNGSVDGYLRFHRASASMFGVFQRAGLQATGLVDGNLGIKGNLSNPTFYGRVLWRNASINGRTFSHPHVDMVCSNGRCVIDLDAIMIGREDASVGSAENGEVSAAGALQYTSNGSKASEGKVTITDTISGQRQEMNSVTAKLSLPARLIIRQWILPRLPEGFAQEMIGSLEQQYSFDDDWVFASVNIRRYGMMLLNGLIPDIGWIGGDSDVNFQLSGTSKNPELKGSIKVKNGHMHPPWMTQPIRSLVGEVELQDSGLLLCKAVSGRCNGRTISLQGGMFLSNRNVEPLENKLRELHEMVKLPDDFDKRISREFQMSLDETESAIRAGRAGIRVEVGSIPIQIPSDCTGTVSGKLLLTGTVLRPRVRGSLVFSEGIISMNGALADRKRTTPVQPAAHRLQVSRHEEPRKSIRKEYDWNGADRDSGKAGQRNHGFEPFCVHMEKLTLSLGRNVKVVHSFLFSVFANGSISISGKTTSPNLDGKIRIVSGHVSALPTRWTVRKSESSYVHFSQDQNRTKGTLEPTVKLVLESDTVILRVAECAVSSWMDNVSLSDKEGIRVQERWWADAIRTNEEDNREGQKITRFLASLMINALAVGRKVGKYDLKFFPTYFGDVLPELSRQAYEKYGAGIQLDHNNCSLESNVFVDKWKGCRVMLKIARMTSFHFFKDQSGRFAFFELRLPGNP